MCTSVLCCAAGGCCSCLGKTMEHSLKKQIRMSYVTLTISIFVVLWILQQYLMSVLEFFTKFAIECTKESGGGITCLGVSAVYRFSLALAIFHALLLFFCSMRNKFAKELNEKAWVCKTLGVIGLFFGLLYVPNSFFEGYAKFARYVGGFFLLFQIVMIIDIFYIWGEKWRASYFSNGEEDGETNTCWGIMLIITSALLYGGTGYFMYMNFKWFTGSDCSNHMIFVIATTVLIAVCTVMTLISRDENKSIITSGAVCVYITYLTWSGLTSSVIDTKKDPNGNCNPFVKQNKTYVIQVIVGIVLYSVALIYVSYASSEQTSGGLKVHSNIDLAAQVLDDEPDIDDEPDKPEEEDSDGDDMEKQAKSKKSEILSNVDKDPLRSYKKGTWLKFHGLMIIGSIYFSMLMTNWAAYSLTEATFAQFVSNNTSMWIKLIAAWVTGVLYCWTLLAAQCCPARNFGNEHQPDMEQSYH